MVYFQYHNYSLLESVFSNQKHLFWILVEK